MFSRESSRASEDASPTPRTGKSKLYYVSLVLFCPYLSTGCTPEVVGMVPDMVDTMDSTNVSAHALGTSEQSVFILDNLHA